MKALDGLLLDRLDAHRADIGRAGRFVQGCGIGGVGLVAANVGAHVLGGQQAHLDTQGIEPAGPVVGRAAGFHDDHRQHND